MYEKVLDQFDRKERGWLVRQCTGGRGLLTDKLCHALGRAFGKSSPSVETWWTIDYHLDWLAGASKWDDKNPDQVHVGGVSGTIEDIDLLVAAQDCLYLIEAKAAGSWNNRQLLSKMKRLDSLCPEGQITFASLGQTVPVRFGLLSIGEARRVDVSGWPGWTHHDKGPYVIDLDGPGRKKKHLTVKRVSERAADPIKWRVAYTVY